jgi:hypothetical protein
VVIDALLMPVWLVAMCVGAVLLARHALLVVRRKRTCAEPLCGQCGYMTKALPTSICPECGADTAVVGVVSYPVAAPLTRVRRVGIWSFAIFLSGLTVDVWVSYHWEAPPAFVVVEGAKYLIPSSGFCQRIYLGDGRERGRLSLSFTHARVQISHVLDVYLPNLGYSYDNYPSKPEEPVKAPDGLNIGTILDWMGAGGIETDHQQIRTEAEELLRLIQALASGGKLSELCGSLQSFTVADATHPDTKLLYHPQWFVISEMALWLLIWLIGLPHFWGKPDGT